MAFYDEVHHGGGGQGLGLAMQLWSAFRNGGTLDQEKAQKAASAAALTGANQQNAVGQVNLQRVNQDWGDQQAVRGASSQATQSLLTPGGIATNPDGSVASEPIFKPGSPLANVLPGVEHMIKPITNEQAPFTPDTLKFYSEMSPEERQTATAPFLGVPDIMRPDTYDAWVSRQTNRLPPIKFPSNYGSMLNGNRQPTSVNGAPIPDYSGDLGKIQPFPRRSVWIPKPDAAGKIVPTEEPAPLGPDQVAFLTQHPEGVQSHFDVIQQPLAKGFVDYRDGKIKNYAEQVKTNPQIGQWIGAGGENKGMQAQIAKVQGIIKPHLLTDAQGNIQVDATGRPLINPKKPLTGSEANALVYAMGSVDNPGMGVRDNEFERIFKAQGFVPKLKAELSSKTGTGNQVSPELTGDIWNLAENTGTTARELAYNNLMGIEQNAAKEGINIDRIMPDVSTQKDYQVWKAGKTAPQFESLDAAKSANIAPGTVVNVNGRLVRFNGTGDQTAANPTEDARVERLKAKPGKTAPAQMDWRNPGPAVAPPGGTPPPRPLPLTPPQASNVAPAQMNYHPTTMNVAPLYAWALRNLVAPQRK